MRGSRAATTRAVASNIDINPRHTKDTDRFNFLLHQKRQETQALSVEAKAPLGFPTPNQVHHEGDEHRYTKYTKKYIAQRTANAAKKGQKGLAAMQAERVELSHISVSEHTLRLALSQTLC